MALPASWTQVKVYGTYLRLDGTPNAGQIWFDSASAVNVVDDNGDTVLVVPKRIVADINENGYFEVMLPATSDPDLDPKGWTYQVKERITGGLEYSIDVPHDLVSLNLVPMRPKVPDSPLTGTINYLTTEDLGNTVARQGDVNTLTTQVATALADATAAQSTVDALTTTVNQAAETANAASAIANGLGDQIADAQTTADAASAASSAAQTAAGQAQADATNALNVANGLADQITGASDDAAAAQAAAAAAQAAASDAQTAAAGALDTANGLADDVAAATAAANDAAAALPQFESDLANQNDSAKGASLVGFDAGRTLRQKIADMDANIAAGGGGGGGGGSYVPPFSGGTTRSFQAKLNDQPVSMLDFYKSTDGNNYTPAINRALGAHLHVYIPAGTWRLATPITMVEHMNLEGANTCNFDAGNATSQWGTVLNCPMGGILNPDKGGGQPARKHIYISNLAFDGDSSGKIGIDGEFGGYVIGCSFDGFGYAIQNKACFLLRIERCNFTSCSVCAVAMSDFNGGTIRECFFQTSCAKHIDMTLTATDGGGQGYPYTITECLFNAGAGSQANQVLVSLRGIVEFCNNYYEDFASAAQGTSWVEILCSGGDHTAFSFRYNEANAHGKSRHALIMRYIGGGQTVHGEVYGNRFSGGWTDPNFPIHFGDVGSLTSNAALGGIKVYGNGGMDVQGRIAPNNGKPFRPIYHTKWSGNIDVSGATPIAVPVGTASTTVFDARGNSANGTNTALIDKDGIWRVTAVGTFGDAGTTMILTQNGTTIESVTGAKQMTLEYTGPLTGGDAMGIKASGGTNATLLSYTQQWICDKDCWA